MQGLVYHYVCHITRPVPDINFNINPQGGAQEHFGVTPDLTTMGKVIGGGLPVGAYGGKREIMEVVAPAGPMYQVLWLLSIL